MRKFKIHPNVACCSYRSGVLHDKNREYPETMWAEGEAMDKVKKGFLVLVTEKKIEVKEPELKKEPEIIKEPENIESSFKEPEKKKKKS